MFATLLSVTLFASSLNPWGRLSKPPASVSSAQVYGSYALGCFGGGVEIPPSGPTWEAVNTQRLRHFGHPEALAFVERLGAAARKFKAGKILIGDVSQPAGGPITHSHASHQAGLDVDIRFRFAAKSLSTSERNGYPEVPVALHELAVADDGAFSLKSALVDKEWKEVYADLLREAAIDSKVDRIFLSPPIKKHLCDRLIADSTAPAPEDLRWLLKIRPYFHHNSHFHVRLKCPDDSPHCHGPALTTDPTDPTGVGCAGRQLARWLQTDPKKDGFLRDEIYQYKRRNGAPKPTDVETDWKHKNKKLPAECKKLIEHALKS